MGNKQQGISLYNQDKVSKVKKQEIISKDMNELTNTTLNAIRYIGQWELYQKDQFKDLNFLNVNSFLSQHNISKTQDLLNLNRSNLSKLHINYQCQTKLINYFNLLCQSKECNKQNANNNNMETEEIHKLLNVTLKDVVYDSKNGIITLNKCKLISSDNDNPDLLKIKINPDIICKENTIYNEENTIYNPLIVLLGISEFKGVSCDSLIGVKYDMIALRNMFENHFGFKVIHENWRMYWDHYALKLFWKRVTEEIIDFPNDKLWGIHDAIIFIISSHGADNEFFDSDEHRHNLYDLYKTFGSDNPKLLNIPRLFFIDACRGNELMGFIDINVISKGNDEMNFEEKEEKKEKVESVKIHKGKNRATLFGQSPGIQSRLDYNIEELEKYGSSHFIRCIIKRFRNYLQSDMNKSFFLTPNLSIIMSDIGKDLEEMSKMRQIPYKNGDASLDQLRFYVKRNKNIDINKVNIFEFDDVDSNKFTKIGVRLYMEDESIVDVSDLTTKQLMSQLEEEKIEQLLPVQAKIIKTEPSKKLKSTKIYHIETVKNKINIKVQLRSIVGVLTNPFRTIICGSVQIAEKHRFIEFSVSNKSRIYSLRLLTAETKLYLEKCKFLRSPKVVNIPYYHNSMASLKFYIVGHKLSENEDNFHLNRIYETGVCGVLQLSVKKNVENSMTETKRIGKVLVVAFRNTDPDKTEQDLEKPLFDIWMINGKGFKTEKLKFLVEKLKDSDYKYKDKIYELDVINDEIKESDDKLKIGYFIERHASAAGHTCSAIILGFT